MKKSKGPPAEWLGSKFADGKFKQRLTRDDAEYRMAATWVEWCERYGGNGVLGRIYDGRRTIQQPSKDEMAAASTVIQWLGTNVGQAFLRDAGFVRRDK